MDFGPDMAPLLDGLKAPGTKPLTDLMRKTLREGNVRTLNTLYNAGADPIALGQELILWKTGVDLYE